MRADILIKKFASLEMENVKYFTFPVKLLTNTKNPLSNPLRSPSTDDFEHEHDLQKAVRI
jgi:hypothetical protein